MHRATLLLVLSVSIIWSIYPVLQKYILRTISPIEYFIVTSTILYACVIGLMFYTKIAPSDVMKKLSAKELAIVLFLGIVGYFTASMLYNELMHKHDSHWVVGITYVTPVLLATIFAIIFLHEGITLKTMFGILLLASGLITISLP